MIINKKNKDIFGAIVNAQMIEFNIIKEEAVSLIMSNPEYTAEQVVFLYYLYPYVEVLLELYKNKDNIKE